jgi:hypothetical protein
MFFIRPDPTRPDPKLNQRPVIGLFKEEKAIPVLTTGLKKSRVIHLLFLWAFITWSRALPFSTFTFSTYVQSVRLQEHDGVTQLLKSLSDAHTGGSNAQMLPAILYVKPLL